MVDIYFITFADTRYRNTLERIHREALSMNIFKDIFICTENDLDQDWRSKHGHFLETSIRGYGYWIWKSQIIYQVLHKVPEGSILIYCDGGSTLVKDAVNTLLYLCQLVKNSCSIGALAFYLDYPEKQWTKMDTMDHLDYYDYDSRHIQSGFTLWRNDEPVRNLVAKWAEISCSHNYHFIDDSPSILPNDPIFKEHRHDQSILGILLKKAKGILIPVIWPDVKEFPVHSTRLKY